jgi:hypothetical protein
VYVAASFDEDTILAYEKEISTRLGLAKTFPSFIVAVKLNVEKW